MSLLPGSTSQVPRAAARVALLYLVFASLWIYASDRLLSIMVQDRVWLEWIGMGKGMAYVAITTLLLYLLLRVWGRGAAGDPAAFPGPPPRKVLLAFIGLAMVVPALAYVVVQTEGERLSRAAYADLEAIAALKAGQIESWLDERRGNARVLMHNTGFINEFDQCLHLGDAQACARVRGRMQALKDVFHYDTELVAPDGRRLLATDAVAEPAGRTLQPLLAAALRTGQAQLSELYRDAHGQARLDLVVPLVQRAGATPRPVGVAVLRTPVRTFLFPLIQAWPSASPSAETLLVRRDGDSALFLNELRHRKGTALRFRLPLNSPELPAAIALRGGGNRIIQGQDYRGIQVVAAARPVRGTSWTLLAKVDRDEVLRPVRQMVAWVSLVGLAADLAVAVAVLLLWRQQQRAHQLELRAQAADKDRLLKLFYDLPFLGMAITCAASKRWLHVNDRLCEMLGYSREELLATSWDRITHPDDLADDLAVYREVVSGERDNCRLVKRYLRKDGGAVLTSLDLRCVRRPDGSAELFVATIEDITERTRAEQALQRQSEELEQARARAVTEQHRLEAVMEALPVGVAIIDAQGAILRINRACEEVWGGACPISESPRGYEVYQGWWADSGTPLAPTDWAPAQVLRTGQAVTGQVLEIQRFDGARGFIINSAAPVLDGAGHLVGCAVTIQDITPLRQAEKALKRSEADLSRAQAVAQAGSWRLDVRRNELTWSLENHRIFGIPPGTPLSYETFLACVHPDDREYVDRMWSAALKGEPYDIEHRLVVGEGGGTAVRWVRERAELEFGAQGELLGGFGITHDITALRLAQQALQEADRRKDEFLAMLAHELRNPLVPIRNAAHVLGRLGLDEPRLKWAQDTIERQVSHLTRLVDDLLEVSRIIQGRITLKQEAVDCAALARQVAETARPNLEAHLHGFELRLPEQPAWVMGDPVRLSQVLINLLDNAAKYTPDGGRIELEVVAEAAEVAIRVRDDGLGIAPELLPRVFDLFQQGERTLDRSQGGLGIGLTLVKQLVEQQGGRVDAQSAGPGRGATFTIRLPRLRELPPGA